VVAPFRSRRGFANRPLALRRSILEVLARRDRLTAHDIAGCAYARRLIVRPGHVRHVTPSQLVATRRALRALVTKGKVRALRRYRRRKVFSLRQDAEQ
jgi:hypothetical protein